MEAKELDALLPLRYKELQNAAADVAKSEQFVDSFANGAAILRMVSMRFSYWPFIVGPLCRSSDYNRRIARYSELASPGEVALCGLQVC